MTRHLRRATLLWLAAASALWFPGEIWGSSDFSTADVITLWSAGLSKEVIMAKITQAGGPFDTGVDALIALQKAALPQEVIDSLLNAPTLASPRPQSGPRKRVVPPPDPNLPRIPFQVTLGPAAKGDRVRFTEEGIEWDQKPSLGGTIWGAQSHRLSIPWSTIEKICYYDFTTGRPHGPELVGTPDSRWQIRVYSRASGGGLFENTMEINGKAWLQVYQILSVAKPEVHGKCEYADF